MRRDKKVDMLFQSLNSSTNVNRNVGFAFLLLLLYITLTIQRTTDFNLFLPEERLSLPIINIQLSLIGFYVLTPLIILVFHFNLLVSLKNHQEVYFAWKKAANHHRDLVYSNPMMVNFLNSSKERTLWRSTIALVVFLTVLLFPIITLIYLQYRFNDYHNFWISSWHFMAVLIDITLAINLFDNILFSNRVISVSRGVMRGMMVLIGLLLLVSAFVWLLTLHLFLQLHGKPGFGFVPTSIIPKIELHEDTNYLGQINDDYVLHYLSEGFSAEDAKRLALKNFGKSLDLNYRDLRYAKLDNIELYQAQLKYAILDSASFKGSSIIESSFHNSSLKGVSFERSYLNGSNFSNSDLTGADLFNCQMERVNLDRARMVGANLSFVNLVSSSLSEANLNSISARNCNFSGSVIEATSFVEASLREARFVCSYLSFSNFSGAILSSTNFIGSDLTSAQFFGADLSGANLSGIEARNTLFVGAVMNRSQLVGAELNMADFSGACLSNANCYGANMTGVVTKAADITNADMTGVESDFNLWDSVYFEDSVKWENSFNWASIGRYYEHLPDSDLFDARVVHKFFAQRTDDRIPNLNVSPEILRLAYYGMRSETLKSKLLERIERAKIRSTSPEKISLESLSLIKFLSLLSSLACQNEYVTYGIISRREFQRKNYVGFVVLPMCYSCDSILVTTTQKWPELFSYKPCFEDSIKYQ